MCLLNLKFLNFKFPLNYQAICLYFFQLRFKVQINFKNCPKNLFVPAFFNKVKIRFPNFFSENLSLSLFFLNFIAIIIFILILAATDINLLFIFRLYLRLAK